MSLTTRLRALKFKILIPGSARKAAIKTRRGSEPSGMDAVKWRKIIFPKRL